jgi:riboflavin synthase
VFSGIIETVGKIAEVKNAEGGKRFRIAAAFPTAELKLGQSVAVSGCCLTLTAIQDNGFEVFLSAETLRCTIFGKLAVGDRVNLERSLVFGQRVDGHLVQGHVEALGMIRGKKPVGESVEIALWLPEELRGRVIPKGSIAVDGISLTVNAIRDDKSGPVIDLMIIPYTLENTTLSDRKPGDACHIETDLLGRYAERLLVGLQRG